MCGDSTSIVLIFAQMQNLDCTPTSMKIIAILFGGKSAEHEISLISAMNILRALDRSLFQPMVIGIDREGSWFLQDEPRFLGQETNPKTVALTDKDRPIAVIPGESTPHLIDLTDNSPLPEPEAVFAILHGPYGEDGTMQGLFRQLNWAFVGPDVLGSAAAMDKDVAKRLLNEAGIPNSPFRTFRNYEREQINYQEITRELQLPLFIKPACMGSSVGISRVTKEEEFEEAVDLAFRFDRKILIEQGIKGREIECAVLGNGHASGSPIGEIVPVDGFYDYEAKYIDPDGAALLIPAPDMSEELIQRVKALAVRTFKVLECEGCSRVDFFLTEGNELYINEVNTLPGFTSISMYPSLWQEAGTKYSDLITELINLALERKAEIGALSSSM